MMTETEAKDIRDECLAYALGEVQYPPNHVKIRIASKILNDLDSQLHSYRTEALRNPEYSTLLSK